jgi:hypothetical protein
MRVANCQDSLQDSLQDSFILSAEPCCTAPARSPWAFSLIVCAHESHRLAQARYKERETETILNWNVLALALHDVLAILAPAV